MILLESIWNDGQEYLSRVEVRNCVKNIPCGSAVSESIVTSFYDV